MAEKLTRARCHVPGHGTSCILAEERRADAQAKARKVRRRAVRPEILDGIYAYDEECLQGFFDFWDDDDEPWDGRDEAPGGVRRALFTEAQDKESRESEGE